MPGIELERDGVRAKAALYYVPRSRGEPHFEDTVSRALYQFHMRPRLDWADLYARLLRDITPLGCDLVTFPPPRRSSEWTASQALADALARILGVPCQQLAFWAGPPSRELPENEVVMRCPQELTGLRVVIVSDFWRTGKSIWQVAKAVENAGAQWAGGVVLAKVVTREEYEQTEEVRARQGAEVAAAQDRLEQYAHNFLQAVAGLPTDDELHARPIWEQLAVCQRALAAYSEWAMRNLGFGAGLSLHPEQDQLEDDFQALVDRVMAALRTAPFAGADEEKIRRLLERGER